MTTREYEIIAGSIKMQHDNAIDGYTKAVLETLAGDLCFKFAQTNTRFNGSKFLQACGMEFDVSKED